MNAYDPNKSRYPDSTGRTSWSTWAWIIGGLIVVGLLIIFAFNPDGEDATDTAQMAPETGDTTVGTDPTADPLEQNAAPMSGNETEQMAGETDVDTSEVQTLIGATSPEGAQPAEDVFEDIEAVQGQRVKVMAEINEVYAPNAFAIDRDGAIGGDELLVLISGDSVPNTQLSEGTQVIIEGTVANLDPAQLEQIPDTSVREQLMEDYADDRVLVVGQTLSE